MAQATKKYINIKSKVSKLVSKKKKNIYYQKNLKNIQVWQQKLNVQQKFEFEQRLVRLFNT